MGDGSSCPHLDECRNDDVHNHQNQRDPPLCSSLQIATCFTQYPQFSTTMTFVHPLLAALLTATAAQAGITISINAVDTAFEPNTAAAAVGDVVEFHFQPSNHSVVRGELDKACEPLEKDGFFSGFVPVKEGETEAVCTRSSSLTTESALRSCTNMNMAGKHLPCQDHRHQADILLLLASQALPERDVRGDQPQLI